MSVISIDLFDFVVWGVLAPLTKKPGYLVGEQMLKREAVKVGSSAELILVSMNVSRESQNRFAEYRWVSGVRVLCEFIWRSWRGHSRNWITYFSYQEWI